MENDIEITKAPVVGNENEIQCAEKETGLEQLKVDINEDNEIHWRK